MRHKYTYSMQAVYLAPARQRKVIHTASPLEKKKKKLIPVAQPLLTLPGEIDLQKSRPYINKGDLAEHGSRINSLCMKPGEAHSSLPCKTLLLWANPWLPLTLHWNMFSWLYEGKPGVACGALCQLRRRTETSRGMQSGRGSVRKPDVLQMSPFEGCNINRLPLRSTGETQNCHPHERCHLGKWLRHGCGLHVWWNWNAK